MLSELKKKYIGKIVSKKSNKPFKSGLKEDVVIDVIIHPIVSKFHAVVLKTCKTYVSISILNKIR